MQNYSVYIANQRIDALIADATHARSAKLAQPSLSERLVKAISTLRGAISVPSASFSR